jgi:hypothetical protein
MAGKQTGKGGNFESKRNPFLRAVDNEAHAPAFAEHPILGGAIDLVLRAECAIILGRTRDGGAVVLTILDGEDRHRTYCSNPSELSEALRAVVELYS